MNTTAVAQVGTPAPGDSALSRLGALPAAAKMKLGLGAAGLIAVLAALSMWSARGDYKVPSFSFRFAYSTLRSEERR